MRDLLALWIIFQLVVLGFVAGTAVNQMEAGVYDCGERKSELDNRVGFVLLPLILFVDVDLKAEEYCQAKEGEE